MSIFVNAVLLFLNLHREMVMKWFLIVCCAFCLSCVDEQPIEVIIPDWYYYNATDSTLTNKIDITYIDKRTIKIGISLDGLYRYLKDTLHTLHSYVRVDGYCGLSLQKEFQPTIYIQREQDFDDYKLGLVFDYTYSEIYSRQVMYFSIWYRWWIDAHSGMDTIGVVGLKLR